MSTFTDAYNAAIKHGLPKESAEAFARSRATPTASDLAACGLAVAVVAAAEVDDALLGLPSTAAGVALDFLGLFF